MSSLSPTHWPTTLGLRLAPHIFSHDSWKSIMKEHISPCGKEQNVRALCQGPGKPRYTLCHYYRHFRLTSPWPPEVVINLRQPIYLTSCFEWSLFIWYRSPVKGKGCLTTVWPEPKKMWSSWGKEVCFSSGLSWMFCRALHLSLSAYSSAGTGLDGPGHSLVFASLKKLLE